MKVLYDHQIFSGERFGGISRYFYELMLNSDGLYDYEVSGIYSENEYIKDLDIYQKFPIKNNFKGKIRLITELNKINSKKIIGKKKDYILHPTYYDPYVLNNKKQPVVLTVYDMIHEKFPHYFINDTKTIKNKEKMLFRANSIIAISENTKRDIIEFYPNIDKKKINVIYLGATKSKVKTKKNRFGCYILFTGKRENYKNFEKLLTAIAPLLLRYDLNLVCTGKPFNVNEINKFKEYGIADKVFYKFASDDELVNLYSNAITFIYPSIYEGFGIPILEAFSCRCPIVLSNTSSFPEVAGDAGIYFDPSDIEDMRIKIESVLCSKDLRREMVMKGSKRLEKFSWKTCAEKTSEVYKSLEC